MDGVDAALVVALFFTLILVVAVGGFMVARKPKFWISFGSALGAAAWPIIVKYITKPNSPEVEAEMAKCLRMGGEWDNFNKKCRYK